MTAHTKGSGLKWVGRAIRRLEDPTLITGQGRFTADLPAVHWVRFVRSPVAAGIISKITAPDAKFGFNEFSRRAGDFALAAALVTYRLQGGFMTDVHVGVGGAEACPRRIGQAEAALNGQTPSDAAFRAAAETAAAAIDPLEDHQTDADYRRDLVRAVVRRALEHSA